MMIVEDNSLGVKQVRWFYNCLVEELDRAVKENEEVVIDFSVVKHIDLSISQVLVAASKEAKKKNVLIKLKSVCDEVKEQMQISGIRI